MPLSTFEPSLLPGGRVGSQERGLRGATVYEAMKNIAAQMRVFFCFTSHLLKSQPSLLFISWVTAGHACPSEKPAVAKNQANKDVL